MLICYVDEAGNTGVYDSKEPTSSPVFVLAGVCVDPRRSHRLLMDYIQLKTQFEPTLRRRRLSEVIQHEVKGAGLRRDLRADTSPRTARRSLIFLDRLLTLLEISNCRIMGGVLIKREGEEYSPQGTYPDAVVTLATTFDQLLRCEQARGLMVLDSRTKVKNEGNVHVITTRRYRKGGSVYPQLIESPLFGHSDTHVLLQIADLLASALIYPAASAVYLPAIEHDPHRSPAYRAICQLFSQRLTRLTYTFTDSSGDTCGGFRVVDRTGRKLPHVLFGD